MQKLHKIVLQLLQHKCATKFVQRQLCPDNDP